jgi:hypothetical protein
MSLSGSRTPGRRLIRAPTFHTFLGLVVGPIAQTRRRTVYGMLTGAGLDRVWHHSRAHRLFTYALWVPDTRLARADLLFHRRRKPGMIPRWRCG